MTRPHVSPPHLSIIEKDKGSRREFFIHNYSSDIEVIFNVGPSDALLGDFPALMPRVRGENEPWERAAYLERFYIAEHLRGVGAAESAFALMDAKCRELGVWAIYTLFAPDVPKDHRLLLSFMQMRGFVRLKGCSERGFHHSDMPCMRKILDPPAWRLRKFFRKVRSSAGTGPWRHHATLSIVDAPCLGGHCAERDLALSILSTGEIRVLKRAAEYSDEVLLALFAHEFGHLLDPTPDEPWGERRADEIGARLIGHRINYDERDMQTIGPGQHPRPGHLHQ